MTSRRIGQVPARKSPMQSQPRMRRLAGLSQKPSGRSFHGCDSGSGFNRCDLGWKGLSCEDWQQRTQPVNVTVSRTLQFPKPLRSTSTLCHPERSEGSAAAFVAIPDLQNAGEEQMNREYHKWYSPRLGRDMELLVFGHAGLPVLVFPTSGGRFYEFEDRNMMSYVWGRVEAGELQFYLRRLGRHGELVQPQRASALAHRPPRAVRRLPHSRSRSARPPEEPGRAPGRAGLQLRRLSRAQRGAAPPRRFHRHAVDVGRVRYHQFPARLLRSGCLLQPAHALSAQHGRSVVSRPLPPQHCTCSEPDGTISASARTSTWIAS